MKFSLSGSVQPEIFRAAIVIQRNCTTAVEAGLAGVPALSPEWIPSWFRMELADRVSIPAQSYAEMHSYVSGALAGNDLRTPERTRNCARSYGSGFAPTTERRTSEWRGPAR